MASKLKLLWMSQTPSIATGYGVTTNETLNFLSKTGKFDIMCQGWYEPPHPKPSYAFEGANSRLFPYKLLHSAVDPKDMTSKTDPRVVDLCNGKQTFRDIIEAYKPDITAVLGDIYMFKWLFEEETRKKTHILGYFPIDSIPVDPSWHPCIKEMDTAITMSVFGQKMVQEIIGRPANFIYLAIDHAFWSTPESSDTIKAQKKEFFGREDVFVFGMVARNQPRKNIPAFFEAFWHHSKTCPNSRILLHAANIDQGWRLKTLAMEYGISDKVFITDEGYSRGGNGVSREDLKRLYNTMDIHVNTAWGEGFGKPIVESMACGVPNFITDYSVANELLAGKGGAAIKVAAFVTEPFTHARHAYISPAHLSSLMTMAVKSPSWVQEAGQRAKITASRMDWKFIGPQWSALFDNMAEDVMNKDSLLTYKEL